MSFIKIIVNKALPLLLALSLLMLAGCDSDKNTQGTDNTDASILTDSLTGEFQSGPEPETDKETERATAATEEKTQAVTISLDTISGLGAESVCTLKNLPKDRALQQMAFAEIDGEQYIFVTQRYAHLCYLSRCKVSEDGKTAEVVDYVELPEYGHAESMDISVHNGKLYIYLGSGANHLNDYYWSTQITRLQYDKGEVSDVRTITGLECATQAGSPIEANYTPYRTNFGLDDTADLIVMYVRAGKNNTSSSIRHFLAAYKLSEINKMLDEAQTIHLKDCTSALVAASGKLNIEDICYNGSFQGMDVAPDGSFCISGGTVTSIPQLSYFKIEDAKFRRTSVKTLYWLDSLHLGLQNHKLLKTYVEIESIKFVRGACYVAFNPEADKIVNHTEIYEIKER